MERDPMKNTGSGKYLLMSAAMIFMIIMVLSILQIPVLADDDRGGVHGAEDKNGLEIQCTKAHYKSDEIVYFNVTSYFDEAIVLPLPGIYNDKGECVGGWVMHHGMPPPMQCSGETIEYEWEPMDPYYNGMNNPGKYQIRVEHGGDVFVKVFWLDGPSDPAESDEIDDGPVLEYPFLRGPEN
jgi:hypothetical protein